jgi:hypothetical protein
VPETPGTNPPPETVEISPLGVAWIVVAGVLEVLAPGALTVCAVPQVPAL